MFLHQFLSLHATKVVGRADGQRELTVYLAQAHLELEVLQLLLFA